MSTVSTALIGFLGVVIGAVVTGFVTLRQAQIATQREREARRVAREQERQDRRDAFQRESILALQDAVGDYWQTALEAWRHTLAVAKNVEAAQSSQQRPIELRLRLDASSARLDAARARVFDPELRSLAVKFQRHAVAVWATKNPDLMEGPHKDASFAQFKMQERVNVLLKELF